MDCIYGSSLPVATSYVYDQGLKVPPQILHNSTGDAVVNQESLEMCKKWLHMPDNANHTVAEKVFPYWRHGFETQEAKGVDYIVDILRKVREQNAALNGVETIRDLNALYV